METAQCKFVIYFIYYSRAVTADQLTFRASSVKNAALLKVFIIPAGVIRDSSPLTVEITVAHDVSNGQGADSDIGYGVSDGIRFIGFEACDKGNYENDSPCYGVEGLVWIFLDRHAIQTCYS